MSGAAADHSHPELEARLRLVETQWTEQASRNLRFELVVADIGGRFDMVTRRLDGQDAVLSDIYRVLNGQSRRFDARFDAIDQRFGAVEARFDAVEAVLAEQGRVLRQMSDALNIPPDDDEPF